MADRKDMCQTSVIKIEIDDTDSPMFQQTIASFDMTEVESAIGARRIRSILKSGMCSMTTFLHGSFCSDDGSEQLSETAAQNRRQNKKIHGGK